MKRSPPRDVAEFLKRNSIVALGAPLIVVLGVQAARKSSEWVEVFVPAARTLLSGGDIYASGTAYLYPPFMAFIIIPFGPLPELAARLGWFVLNLASVAGVVRCGWLLGGGAASLGPLSAETKRDWIVAAAGIVCGAPYILNAMAHQQVDVMIAFLVVAGCFLLERGRGIGGAVLLGLAAACKGPPLLFAAYLIFRRNWLSAGLIVLVALGVNLLPDLIIAPPGGAPRLMVWAQRYVFPALSGQLGGWNGLSVYNQSLAGTVQRLFTTTLQFAGGDVVYVTNFRAIPENVIKATAYGLMLALLLSSIFASLHGQERAQTRIARFPSHTALELSAVSLLALLMSPMSDLAHLGPLVLPAFCLARIALFGGDRWIGAAVVFAAAAALTVNKDLVREASYTIFLWAGIATWSMLALWAGCVRALALSRGEPAAEGFRWSIFPFWHIRRLA